MEIKDVLMGTMDGKEIFRLNEINNITYVDDSINPDISIEPYYNFGKQTEFTADFSADFSADLRRIIDSVGTVNSTRYIYECECGNHRMESCTLR